MCLTIDHEILTENGWKDYKSVQRKEIAPNGTVIKENEKIKVYDITTDTISFERFIGDVYFISERRVIYDIKNEYIDTSITEDHNIIYKFDLSDEIKINKLNKILYNMTVNNYTKFYLFTNSETISPIEINKDDIIRDIKTIDVFSFITSKNTYYVRRNNLEFWTSY
jgi:hypothetical protein